MNQFQTISNYILHDVRFQPDREKCVLRIVDFMLHNKSIEYFPLDKIVDISRCESDESGFQIATFLCSERVNLLRPVYAYIKYDNTEVLLTKSEFSEALNTVERGEFTTNDGITIDSFRRDRLDFYFVRPNRNTVVVDGLDF